MKVKDALNAARCFTMLDMVRIRQFESAMACEDWYAASEILYRAYADNVPVLDHNVFVAYLSVAQADINSGALTRTGAVRKYSRPRCPTRTN